MTHSIAALLDHNGPSRRDDRARRLAARLCETLAPPAAAHHRSPSETQLHTDVERRDSDAPLRGSKSCACSAYWRAREQLAAVRNSRMVTQVRPSPHRRSFRYPNIRLNQINFSAELQACAASMSEDPRLLRVDYRRQLSRFLRGVKRAVAPWRIANLGPSYNFHRNPFQSTVHPKTSNRPSTPTSCSTPSITTSRRGVRA